MQGAISAVLQSRFDVTPPAEAPLKPASLQLVASSGLWRQKHLTLISQPVHTRIHAHTARSSGQTAWDEESGRTDDNAWRFTVGFVHVCEQLYIHSEKNTLSSCCLIVWRQGAPNYLYFFPFQGFHAWMYYAFKAQSSQPLSQKL